jgi:hypothetical protein
MNKFITLISSRRRFHQEIDKHIEFYKIKLGSGELVDPEEAAKCHAMKLVMEREAENRLRSIQTLAQLRDPAGIGPTVNDLVSVSRKWPKIGIAEHAWLLACALKDLLTQERDECIE